MTYSQLMEAGDYSKTTAINHVKLLEEAGAVEVTRSPIYLEDNKPRNLPNKYKLNLDIGLVDNEQNTSVMKSVKSPSEYNRVG
ncbi:winged helix-turn-helix domain-containing protein [Oceanobacillus halotolerans]|uniref:winged helix-turn-helix domain-containing protein n=1 Tax=Oceanobacillus halotolerans TaxID=2663380 RepID=UPI0013D16629|nr:helix-turn-helix domain-containing protein [Oceanobacillus halotolerans]